MVVCALANPPPPTTSLGPPPQAPTTPTISASATKDRQRDALSLSLCIDGLPVRAYGFRSRCCGKALKTFGELANSLPDRARVVVSDNSARRHHIPGHRMSRAWREA